MAKVTAFKKDQKKPAFDPSANYKWEPDDVFEITGQDLANLYHCLNREINEPTGATIYLKYEAFTSILEVLRRGVEQGVIVEMDTPIEEIQVEELKQNVDKLFSGKKAPYGADRNPDDLPHWHPNS